MLRTRRELALHQAPRQSPLAALAADQGGYFTAKQAKEAGYDYPHLEYHLSTGNFERVDHGLYRLSLTLQRYQRETVPYKPEAGQWCSNGMTNRLLGAEGS